MKTYQILILLGTVMLLLGIFSTIRILNSKKTNNTQSNQLTTDIKVYMGSDSCQYILHHSHGGINQIHYHRCKRCFKP